MPESRGLQGDEVEATVEVLRVVLKKAGRALACFASAQPLWTHFATQLVSAIIRSLILAVTVTLRLNEMAHHAPQGVLRLSFRTAAIRRNSREWESIRTFLIEGGPNRFVVIHGDAKIVHAPPVWRAGLRAS